ncbi:glycoside hydrolase family protein [Nonomuraea sp. NPDC049709]|uniref:glycoside hydrolase family protein n=1 Tax=Nonomuraea sp. NPDC049709 TaxID=3154736 RepID=UPI003436CCC4
MKVFLRCLRRWPAAVALGLMIALAGTGVAAADPLPDLPAIDEPPPDGGQQGGGHQGGSDFPCPGGGMGREMRVGEIKEFIAWHESRQGLSGDPKVYVDTEGHPTVGIGFNLDRRDAPEKLAGVGADYDDVRAGRTTLTQMQITMLFEGDLAAALAAARRVVPQFESLSMARQAALVDMVFNLGPTGVAQFQQMLAAIARGGYEDAAQSMINSAWARQVGKRALEDATMMSQGLTCRPEPLPVPPPPVSPDIPGLDPGASGGGANGGTSYPGDVTTYQPDWGPGPSEHYTCTAGVEVYYNGHWVSKVDVECA